MKIYIASDHAGLNLKNHIVSYLANKFSIVDFGTDKLESCDYNVVAKKMIENFIYNSPNDVSSDISLFGILICKSGTGMSIFANRFPKIRACNALNKDQVFLSRAHNNSNIICFGESFISIDNALDMIDIFLNTKFENGRHVNRLILRDKICINLDYNCKIDDKYNIMNYTIKNFPSGEIEFTIHEDIFDKNITIFQSFNKNNFNRDLIKLQIVCDVLKRNNVRQIQYCAPFIPYMRQDRTYDTKSSLGSKIIADLINSSNISEITTYDLHTLQAEGFFRGKVNHLSMIPIFIDDIKKNFQSIKDIVIVFPDVGAASRFKRFFDLEFFSIAIIHKIRSFDGSIKMEILGDVKNKINILIDDMIDGGNTIIEATKQLFLKDAKSVFVYATHGIFSNNAVEKLIDSDISRITISNSISSELLSDKINIIPCDTFFNICN